MKPNTVRALKESGYSDYSIRDELRNNTIEKIKAGKNIFSGIIGYDTTVIPHVINAVLAGP